MDKYRREEKPKSELSDIKENEIRITTQGKMRNYITYATNLLTEPTKPAVEIVLKAMGRAINKTVTIAEIIKRRVGGLHQNTQIDSTDITDVWLPLEEGLHRLETTRHVSSIQITLSTKPLDITQPGYQPPIPADQVRPISADIERPRRPRGRGARFPRGVGRGRGSPEQAIVGGPPQVALPPQLPPIVVPEEVEGGGMGGGRPYRGRGRGSRFRGPRQPPQGGFGGDGGHEQVQVPQAQPLQPQIQYQLQDNNNNNQYTGEGQMGGGRGRFFGGRGRGRGGPRGGSRGRGGRGGRGDGRGRFHADSPVAGEQLNA